MKSVLYKTLNNKLHPKRYQLIYSMYIVVAQLFVRVISLTALSTCFFRPDPVFNPPWFHRQFPPHFRPVISTTFRRVISTIFQRARSAWFRLVPPRHFHPVNNERSAQSCSFNFVPCQCLYFRIKTKELNELMLMSTITTVRNTQNTANPAILNLMNLTKYISIIDKDMLFVVLYYVLTIVSFNSKTRETQFGWSI